MAALHTADYAVLAVYIALVIIICVRVTRASPDADDLFLAGRSLGWGVVGFSLFASNISSTTLIGLPGDAWRHGIAVANYEWMAALVLLFSTFVVVPVFLGKRIRTVPELLYKRFDGRMRLYLSSISVFLSIVLDTAGSLYAGAIVLKLFFPAFSLELTVAGIAIFAGLYTAAGGLRAVAYTDVVQAVVLLGGSALLTLIVFGEFGYSWAAVKASLAPEKLSLIRPLDDPQLPWLGTLIGLPVLGFYYWTMNQYVSQRLLGARDMSAAGWGAVFAATLKLLPLFLMVLPGAMAAALLPDLERADSVFPRLIAEYAPVGLSGLILAGLLAAIMSSVDSALNSASTLVSVDFVLPRRPELTARQLARIGRIATLCFVAFAAVWAPMIDHFPGLFAYLQQGFAYVASPLVATFMLGLLGRRVGASAAFYGTLSGHALSLVLFVLAQRGHFGLHFTIVAGLLVLATALFCGLWALLLHEQPSAAQLAAVSAQGLPAAPRAVQVSALALVVMVAAIVIAFR